jgi:DNA-binding Lrp family transcriptional regulator
MKDAQTPFSTIAKQLGIGTDTVIRKYNKLKKEGVIHSASVIVDLEKCGYKGHVFFLVSVLAGADSSRLFEELIKITNVLTVIHTIGDYDFVLHCIYHDIDNLIDLQKQITAVNGIKYLSVVCLSTKDFIPTFPAIGYYSKALQKGAVKGTP